LQCNLEAANVNTNIFIMLVQLFLYLSRIGKRYIYWHEVLPFVKNLSFLPYPHLILVNAICCNEIKLVPQLDGNIMVSIFMHSYILKLRVFPINIIRPMKRH